IDQRPNRRVLLVLGQCRVVQRSDQPSLLAEQGQKALVINVETQCLGGRIKVCAIDEKRDLLVRMKMHMSPREQVSNRLPARSPTQLDDPKAAPRPRALRPVAHSTKLLRLAPCVRNGAI